MWNITMLKNEPSLSYRRFKKVPFLKKKSFFYFFISKLLLHIFFSKTDFLLPDHLFESLITHKRFVFKDSYITFHMVNVKRVVLWLLFRPYGCILHPRFIIRRQSHTGFFYCKGGSRLLNGMLNSISQLHTCFWVTVCVQPGMLWHRNNELDYYMYVFLNTGTF